MADITEFHRNGDNDTPSEFFDSTDFPPLKTPAADVERLNKTISDLEKENSASESRIAELTSELSRLRVEKDAELEKLRVETAAELESSESHARAAEMIAKRAAELETEVARLQHDLISAVNSSAESDREIKKLTAEIAVLMKEKSEVESKVESMAAKMEELIKKSNDSDDIIRGFMQKIEDREIEATLNANRSTNVDEEALTSGGGGCDRVVKRLKENYAAVTAVTGGVIIAGGVMCYVKNIRN